MEDHSARPDLPPVSIDPCDWVPLAWRIIGSYAEKTPTRVQIADISGYAFIGLVEACKSYRPEIGTPIMTWLSFHIGFRIKDGLRKLDWASLRWRQKGKACPTMQSDSVLQNKELPDNLGTDLKVDLEEALSQLKPKEEEAFRLCKLKGFRQTEAARIMGMHDSSVSLYIASACKKLSRILSVYSPY